MYPIYLFREIQQQMVACELHCVCVITGQNIEEIDLLHAIVYEYIGAIQNYFTDYIDLCSGRIHPIMMA